jgi:hypothetical protein
MKLKPYDSNKFTYGMEIEWGDVPRSFSIPEELGTWEFSERDIINLREPYQYVCADPLGEDPPFGGEINTKPTKTWQEQVHRYFELQRIFIEAGHAPTVGVTAHSHIHCRVPGLRNDIAALKRLTKYIKENQATAIDHVYGYFEHNQMKGAKGAKMYLKYDGGRPMPDYMSDNIINLATDFESFIKMHAAGKDGVSMGRPFRYAINMYALKHIDTVEFRLFRGTLRRVELESCFRFVKDFLDAGLNDGPSVQELIEENNYVFPPMMWDLNQFIGWEKTKHPEDRGEKVRTYVEVV